MHSKVIWPDIFSQNRPHVIIASKCVSSTTSTSSGWMLPSLLMAKSIDYTCTILILPFPSGKNTVSVFCNFTVFFICQFQYLYDRHKNYFIDLIIRSETEKLFLRTKLTKSNTAKAAASAQDGFRSSLASFWMQAHATWAKVNDVMSKISKATASIASKQASLLLHKAYTTTPAHLESEL